MLWPLQFSHLYIFIIKEDGSVWCIFFIVMEIHCEGEPYDYIGAIGERKEHET